MTLHEINNFNDYFIINTFIIDIKCTSLTFFTLSNVTLVYFMAYILIQISGQVDWVV